MGHCGALARAPQRRVKLRACLERQLAKNTAAGFDGGSRDGVSRHSSRHDCYCGMMTIVSSHCCTVPLHHGSAPKHSLFSGSPQSHSIFLQPSPWVYRATLRWATLHLPSQHPTDTGISTEIADIMNDRQIYHIFDDYSVQYSAQKATAASLYQPNTVLLRAHTRTSEVRIRRLRGGNKQSNKICTNTIMRTMGTILEITKENSQPAKTYKTQ